MSGPLWSGDGIDPFLPARLAAEATLTAAERDMYNTWWGSFSDWLVRVRRNVLTGGVPDPHGIWSTVPLWAEQMQLMVNGPVRDLVGNAFGRLFGTDYLFDARPGVTAYLAAVRNRMVRTPNEVYDVVASQVARGAAAGEGVPSIAARVEDILTVTGTENWRGRAVTVARTESIGALNAGRTEAFAAVADELGGEFVQRWLATIDRRTRPEHLAADEAPPVPVGQPFIVGGEPLMFPGDPSGSAEMIINCRCSTLLLRAGETTDMTGRGFSDADEYWAGQIDAA